MIILLLLFIRVVSSMPSMAYLDEMRRELTTLGEKTLLQMSDQPSELCMPERLYINMDRICEMCHENFRDQDVNIRYKCRNNCFDNLTFSSCMQYFVG